LVEQYGKVSAADNADFGFGCDPMGRVDWSREGGQVISGAHTTKLEFSVPFVVDG